MSMVVHFSGRNQQTLRISFSFYIQWDMVPVPLSFEKFPYFWMVPGAGCYNQQQLEVQISKAVMDK
jgi:hypothetical protein